MATNESKVKADVFSHERLNNSVNGGPTYSVATSEGTFRTISDGAVGHDIPNLFRGKRDAFPAILTLRTSRKGVRRIVHIEEVSE